MNEYDVLIDTMPWASPCVKDIISPRARRHLVLTFNRAGRLMRDDRFKNGTEEERTLIMEYYKRWSQANRDEAYANFLIWKTFPAHLPAWFAQELRNIMATL